MQLFLFLHVLESSLLLILIIMIVSTTFVSKVVISLRVSDKRSK